MRTQPRTYPALGEAFARNLRYGLRRLRRSPGFTAVAVLTMATGIGASSAVFSVVRGLLLKPLPYPGPERVVFLSAQTKEGRGTFTGPDFVDYQEHTRVLEGLAFSRGLHGVSLTGPGEPETVKYRAVSRGFLSALGLKPHVGRDFLPEDEPLALAASAAEAQTEPAPGALLVSHGLWQRRWGGDASVVGSLVELQGEPHRIIGVAPRGFELLLPAEFDVRGAADCWLLSGLDLARMPRSVPFLRVIGRLAPGANLAQARAEADVFARQQRAAHTRYQEDAYAVHVNPLHREVVQGTAAPVWILFGAVGCVLLIACANVANLLLGRTRSRRREFALRLALGAGRPRIVWQLLTESGLIALFGAAAGLLLASWGVPLIIALAPDNIPRLEQVRLDGAVVGFTLAVSVAASLLFGLLPALLAARSGLAAALKEGARGSAGQGRSRWQGALVVGEVALCLVLVIGAGLLVKSFVLLGRVDVGFNTERLFTASIRSPGRYPRYPSAEARVQFVRRLQESLESLPEVETATFATVLPLSGDYAGHTWATKAMAAGEPRRAEYRPVTPGYFQTMGTPLLAGRDLTWLEAEQARPVVIVDERLAKSAWPGENPLGRRLRLEVWTSQGQTPRLTPVWAEVVGVAANVRSRRLTATDTETVYLPYGMYATAELALVARTRVEPLALARDIRRSITAVDPHVPIYKFQTMKTYLADALAPLLFSLTLLSVFGTIGLGMAAVGLYGVVSLTVGQRTHEIGVRMALGARPRDVLRLVMRRGLVLATLGVGLGLAGAYGMMRLLANQLFDVAATDGATFAGVSVLLAAVALLASYIPARRAVRIDPLATLNDASAR